MIVTLFVFVVGSAKQVLLNNLFPVLIIIISVWLRRQPITGILIEIPEGAHEIIKAPVKCNIEDVTIETVTPKRKAVKKHTETVTAKRKTVKENIQTVTPKEKQKYKTAKGKETVTRKTKNNIDTVTLKTDSFINSIEIVTTETESVDNINETVTPKKRKRTVTPKTESVENKIETLTPNKKIVKNNIEIVTPKKGKGTVTRKTDNFSNTIEIVTTKTETVENNIENVTFETVENDIKTMTINTEIEDVDSVIACIRDKLEKEFFKERMFSAYFVQKGDTSTMYDVNGDMFFDDQRSVMAKRDADSATHYELYRVEHGAGDGDESGDDEDMWSPLAALVQRLPSGVVVNSNVFLTAAQWHTTSRDRGDIFRCIVCRAYCDSAKWEEHIGSANHLRNLNKYKPLKRYDLSIVRKINDNLHCGVCNELIDISDFSDHEGTKSHEGNLLRAINKVSDIMYDSNIQTNCEMVKNGNSFDRNSNTVDGNSNTVDGNSTTVERNSTTVDRNSNTVDRNSTPVDRNLEGYHYDANSINNKSMRLYEDISDNEGDGHEGTGYEGTGYEGTGYEGTGYEVHEVDDEYTYDGEEYSTPCEGISYASMASKPMIKLPKYLKIDLGTREVVVKFESWHMLAATEPNMFYCMACRRSELRRNKSRHCGAPEHVARLARCAVLHAFEDYLVRQVDDKLYHCGHCNNLQPQYLMQEHINSVHPKRNKKIIDTVNTSSAPHSPKLMKKQNKSVVETNNNKIAIGKAETEIVTNAVGNKMAPGFDIFGDVTITPFGLMQLRISAMSYNIVIEKDGGYYCAVCDEICPDVREHVEGMGHFEILNMTPFIKPFKLNLTRAVRGTLHCGLCNELISVRQINEHNMEQAHTTALANAMGMVKNKLTHKNTDSTQENRVKNALADVGQKRMSQFGVTQSANSEMTASYIQNTYNVTVQGINTDKTAGKQKESGSPLKISTPLASQTASPQKTRPHTEQLTSDAIKPEISQNSAQSKPNAVPNQVGVNQINIGQGRPILAQNQPNNGQNYPNIGQHYPNAGQHYPNAGQNYPHAGQNYPNIGQHFPNLGQSYPNIGQQIPHLGQKYPNVGQNYPNVGQNYLNIGQNYPNMGPNQNVFGKSHPNVAQNHQNIRHIPNSGVPGQNSPTIGLYRGQNVSYGQARPNMGQTHSNTGQNNVFQPSTFVLLPPAPINNSFVIFNPNPAYQPGTNRMPNVLYAQNIANQANINNQNHKGNKEQHVKSETKSSEKNRVKSISESSNGSVKSDSFSSVKDMASVKDNIGSVKDNIGSVKDNIGSVKDNIGSVKDNIGSVKDITGSVKGDDRLDGGKCDSDDENDENVFDLNEYVFLKLKTSYFKITNLSYHSLVYLDNGIRYCFVCSNTIRVSVIQRHIESREHTDNIAKNKFLVRCGASVQLFRQMYLMYHCAICNVLMTRKEIKLHLDWTIHIDNYDEAHMTLNKINRKKIKSFSGIKEYVASLQKEVIFHNVNEPKMSIVKAYKIVPDTEVGGDVAKITPVEGSKPTVVKKNKMVILNNAVMKVGFDPWHGITSCKNLTRCIVCQLEITPDEVLDHVETKYHSVALGKPFEKMYYPALIRKINENTVNCMICNLELQNVECLVLEHTNGRKHKKYQDAILNESSYSDSYADCYEEHLIL